MNLTRHALIRPLSLVLLLFAAASTWATTVTWTNTSGGNWSVAANWSPNQIPGILDTALINTPGAYIVSLSQDSSAANLTVGDGAGTQTLQIEGFTLTAPNISVLGTLAVAGSTINGAITINSGGELDALSGTVNISRALVIQSGASLNLAARLSTVAPITNAGTINMTNAVITLYNNNTPTYGSGLDNKGQINFFGTTGDQIDSELGDEYFFNEGTVNVQPGSGTSSVNAGIGSLTGTYNAALGTILQFYGSSAAANPLIASAPPTLNGPGQYKFVTGYLELTVVPVQNLDLIGGVLSLGPAFQQNGAITNLTLDGITLAAGTNQISGTLIATNTVFSGAITVNSGGTLDVSSASLAGTGSLTVLSGGTLNAAVRFSVSGPITNAGTINETNATIALYNNNTATYAGGIVNQGQINFYGAAGDQIYAELGNEYMINQGTVNILPGTGTSSIIVGVGALAGVYNAAMGTTLQFTGGSAANPLIVGAPPVMNGPGQFGFVAGALLLTQDTIPNLPLTAGTLLLGPAFQEGGAITNLTLDGITLAAGTNQINGTLIATNTVFSGAVTVNSGGELDVSGASLAGTGSLTVLSGGTLNVAVRFGVSGPVTNAGTINETNATIALYNNNTATYAGGIVNQGQINFYGAAGDQIYAELGNEYMINQGTVNILPGTGTSSIIVGVGALAGVYNAAMGTTLQFTGGSAANPLIVGAPPVMNGPGQFGFVAGALLLTQDTIPNLPLTAGTLLLGPAFQEGGAITNLTLDGITLAAGTNQINGTLIATNTVFSGAVTVNSGGELDVSGASLAGTGSLTVLSGGTLNVAVRFGVSGPVTNAGTINETNATIALYNNNTATYAGGIVNQGQINFYGAAGDQIYAELGNEYMINQGTVNIQPGTGTSVINVSTGSIAGTYNAAMGTTLQFTGGSAATPLVAGTPPIMNGPGQFEFVAGSLLLTKDMVPNLTLLGGTLHLGPAFQQSGAVTNLTLDGATLGIGTYQVDGTLTASNSTLSGTITVNSGGTVYVSGASLAGAGSLTILSGGTLNVAVRFGISGPMTNAGTINETNATIALYNNNTATYAGGIINQGQINFYGASGDQIYGELGDEFLMNEGTISQVLGTGNSLISIALFSNPGTVDSQQGTLTLSTVSLQASSVLNFGLNSPTDFGAIAVGAGTVLSGTVSADFNKGYEPSIGQSFKVLTYPAFSGVFGMTNLPDGDTAQGVYGATAFSLLITSTGTAPNQPILTIARVGAGTVNISWPTASGNFNLQTSPNLTTGTWSNISGGITTVGPDFVLTTPVNGNAAFYRLKSP